MVAPFRLQAGEPAPIQQSSTTCGSACLTVARMLVDAGFARWIRLGLAEDAADDAAPDPRSQAERFAAHEELVAGRTNGLIGAGGRLQLPWPRALGTPPWGARRELEYGAADPDADYDISWFRLRGRRGLEVSYAGVLARVREGRPVLLYIGNGWMPRHVVLVLPPATDSTLPHVYEPSAGHVVSLHREPFVTRRLRLAGWDVPWAAVWADAAWPGSGGSPG